MKLIDTIVYCMAWLIAGTTKEEFDEVMYNEINNEDNN
jgi:hypothetical protein